MQIQKTIRLFHESRNAHIWNTTDDLLIGSFGKDKLTGGNGSDQFLFNTVPNTRKNVDVITDFTHGQDKIVLDHMIFSAFGAAPLSEENLAFGKKAQEADNFLIYNIKKGTLYYDADGAGIGAAVQVAILGKGVALDWHDFVIT